MGSNVLDKQSGLLRLFSWRDMFLLGGGSGFEGDTDDVDAYNLETMWRSYPVKWREVVECPRPPELLDKFMVMDHQRNISFTERAVPVCEYEPMMAALEFLGYDWSWYWSFEHWHSGMICDHEVAGVAIFIRDKYVVSHLDGPELIITIDRDELPDAIFEFDLCDPNSVDRLGVVLRDLSQK